MTTYEHPWAPPAYPDARSAFRDLAAGLLSNGRMVAPRDQMTLELRGVSFGLESASAMSLPVGIRRKLSGRLAALEALGVLAGVDMAAILAEDFPAMAAYMDSDEDGKPFYQGAYGPRVKVGLAEAVAELQRDPYSRRAVVSLWRPSDYSPGWRDRPCTLTWQFMLRRNHLDMDVYMRSNDLWLGTTYDVFQFTQVQLVVANVLRAEPGAYRHHVGSLHAYEHHWERLEQLATQPRGPDEPESVPRWDTHEYRDIHDVRARALALTLSRLGTTDVTGYYTDEPDFAWFAERIKPRGN